MSKGKWRTTKERMVFARDAKRENPTMSRAQLVKSVMEQRRISYAAANRAVQKAEIYWPREFLYREDAA